MLSSPIATIFNMHPFLPLLPLIPLSIFLGFFVDFLNVWQNFNGCTAQPVISCCEGDFVTFGVLL